MFANRADAAGAAADEDAPAAAAAGAADQDARGLPPAAASAAADHGLPPGRGSASSPGSPSPSPAREPGGADRFWKETEIVGIYS